MNVHAISTPMPLELFLQGHTTRAPVIHERLQLHLDRLQALFFSLYPRPDDAQYLQLLLAIMSSRINERCDTLFALDTARTENPGWFTDNRQMGYMAYTDRLAGTLAGVKQRIPHLQSLGITYLHLLPFLKARDGANDGGFAVSSFNDINPSLGTREDLRSLTQALREKGISLCSDIVLNHVADDHEWVKRARAGDADYRRYFHCLTDEAQVKQLESELKQVFPETAPGNFTYIPDMKSWVWTTFYPYQWDLNWSNPAVLVELVDAMLDLANLGVEAFRLDSAGYLWKQPGTICMNLPQTHDILKLLRACFEIAAPAVLLKAEAIVPTRDLPPYFGLSGQPAPECHLAYHSSLMSAIWMAVAEQDADILKRVIQSTPRLPEACSWITYVRCHDDIGWNVLRPELEEAGDPQATRLVQAAAFMNGQTAQSFSGGEAFQSGSGNRVHGTNGMTASLLGLGQSGDDETLARLNLVFGLIACVGGLPLIYMGDEWAQGNASRFATETWAAEDGRRLQRPHWDEALTVTDTDSIHARQYKQVAAWQAARLHYPQLSANTDTTVLDTKDARLLALRRGSDLVIVANLSDDTVTLSPSDAVSIGCGDLTLGPWNIRIIEGAHVQ